MRTDTDEPRAKRKVTKYEPIREKWHYLRVQLWQLVDGEVRTFDHYGGTQMFYRTNAGKFIFDEDAAKKSFTDATNKLLSMLGVAADIYLGLFDDKYQGFPAVEDTAPEQSSPPVENKEPRPAGNRQTSADDGFKADPNEGF